MNKPSLIFALLLSFAFSHAVHAKETHLISCKAVEPSAKNDYLNEVNIHSYCLENDTCSISAIVNYGGEGFHEKVYNQSIFNDEVVLIRKGFSPISMPLVDKECIETDGMVINCGLLAITNSSAYLIDYSEEQGASVISILDCKKMK